MIAFLFPGQGSQAVGMGRGFYESSPGAKALFEEANAALGFDLTKLAFEGPEAELALTANTQPAVLAASVATAAACAERGLQPAIAAGHSLGEYSALVAAGALRFADAIRVVRKRGQLETHDRGHGAGAHRHRRLHEFAAAAHDSEGIRERESAGDHQRRVLAEAVSTGQRRRQTAFGRDRRRRHADRQHRRLSVRRERELGLGAFEDETREIEPERVVGLGEDRPG